MNFMKTILFSVTVSILLTCGAISTMFLFGDLNKFVYYLTLIVLGPLGLLSLSLYLMVSNTKNIYQY